MLENILRAVAPFVLPLRQPESATAYRKLLEIVEILYICLLTPLISYLQSWEGTQLLMFCSLCPTGWSWTSSALCLTAAPTCWPFATLWPGSWPALKPCSGDKQSSSYYRGTFEKTVCVYTSGLIWWYQIYSHYICWITQHVWRKPLWAPDSVQDLSTLEFLCNTDDFFSSCSFWLSGFVVSQRIVQEKMYNSKRNDSVNKKKGGFLGACLHAVEFQLNWLN